MTDILKLKFIKMVKVPKVSLNNNKRESTEFHTQKYTLGLILQTSTSVNVSFFSKYKDVNKR